jgi:hypothetical protein
MLTIVEAAPLDFGLLEAVAEGAGIEDVSVTPYISGQQR